MLALLKKTADWLVISAGVVTGVYVSVWLLVQADRQVPLLPICLFTVVALFPLISSIIATRNRRRAALLLLYVAPAVGFIVFGGLGLRDWLSQSATWSEIAIAVVVVMAIPVTLGFYWLITDRSGWGPVIRPRAVSRGQAVALACSGALVFLLLVFVGVFAGAVRLNPFGDCSGYDPTFVRPISAGHTAFIGKVVYVGGSDRVAGRKLGTWAILRVEKQFWGLRPWNSRFVVLTQSIFEPGQEYFVSGHYRDGLLTHGLIVESDLCRSPMPLKDAGVELRVLRDGPPKDGVRIIGRVIRVAPGSNPVSGINVVITGTAGSITTTTDASGIYDVTGIPPRRYSIRTDTYNSRRQEYPSCGSRDYNPTLASGDVWGCTIYY